jgi:DNA-binding MarR family transcriptional regulator
VQQFEVATDRAGDLATLLMDIAPAITRIIRDERRKQRGIDLSIPQFRTLGRLDREPGSSLNDIADFLGLTPPAASRLVDGLVARGLVTRSLDPGDRRRLMLRVTPAGATLLDQASAAARAHLADLLSALTPDEQARVAEALAQLAPIVRRTRRKSVHD